MYAIHGCFYHGHLACKKNSYSKRTKNPKLGKSMGDLHSYLQKLKRRVIYYDTDSIIYKSHPGAYGPNIGDQIGSMTDELSGHFIVEFVSNGAKTYGYRANE